MVARVKKSAEDGSAAAPASTLQIGVAVAALVQAAPAIMAIIHYFPFISDDHVTLFVCGLVLLAITAGLFYFVLVKTLKLTSVMGLIFTFIVFTAYIDTMISLCLTSPRFFLGRFYLDKGERYFNSTYGFMCLFWDGTFHVAIQFTLAVLALSNREYHFTALVWAGSVLISMAPLLFGAAIGPFSDQIQLSTALNAPYVFLPLGVIIMLLTRTPAIHRKEGAGKRVHSHHTLTDVVLMAYNFLVPVVHILRVMATFDSQSRAAKYWRTVEPVFDRHAQVGVDDKQDYAFMAVQAVEWAFWFVPWHWAALYEQIVRIATGKRSVLLGTVGVDLSAVVLGGYLQSLACHIVTSYFDMNEGVVGLHKRANTPSLEFWVVNTATLVCAGLHFVHFYVQDIEDVMVKKD